MDDQSDSYKTVTRDNSDEISIKGSKFIAYIFPASSEGDTEKILHEIRTKYHDATHHCYAFVLDSEGSRISRYNDDGEPSGTAGRPILTVLEGNDLVNVICIVVRYFGGTKLGVGGLSRAYSDAAREVVNSSRIETRIITGEVEFEFPYSITGTVERLISDYKAEISSRDFGDEAKVICSIRISRIPDFIKKFNDITRGQGKIKQTETN
ncbi:MAG: YigZ family protein [bacterium]|nr:YigZ family protein [bacterium]